VRVVLAARDPGVPNWIDTVILPEERRRRLARRRESAWNRFQ